MEPILLRDQDLARQYLLQGLWLQRAMYPGVGTVRNALMWSLMIADAGQPLPPTGFVADLGHIALGKDREGKSRRESVVIPGLPPGLVRTYEDHVLGKFFSDGMFERASDALKRIPNEKQGLGIAYIIKQIRERGGIGGVELSPGIIRGLLESANKPEDLLRRGWESLRQSGPMPLLIGLYQRIIAAARSMADALSKEDCIALEQKTALLSMGEYVAHRQIVQMANRLEDSLPKQKVAPLAGRRAVPTRVLDEDAYPVGGFASISTRGSIESLLHSQLAYIEEEKERRPDLFDIKFLRDELYYYSRDENQSLRRRRSFLFVLCPDLVLARFKDADLPCQRLVLVLSFLLASVHQLTKWLSDDALRFEFLFVQDAGKQPLEEEKKLLDLLFREEIENNSVAIEHVPTEALEERIKQHARRSQCQCLVISTKDAEIHSDEAVVAGMRIDSSRPIITVPLVDPANSDTEDPFDDWTVTLLRLLRIWI